MEAEIPLAWLRSEVMLPGLVGLSATVLAVLALRFLTRARPLPPQPAQVEELFRERPKDPEYDPFVQGSSSEQRKSYRRSGNPVEVWIRNPTGGLPPMRGLVLNRSAGGLCLALETMVEEGIGLEVRPANAPHVTPWVEVEVRSCRRSDHGWEAGCQFVRTPPWAILLMFG